MGGDKPSGSTRHRSDDQNRGDGDDDRTHGDESEYERRHRKGSRQRREDDQGKGKSRRRNRSQSHDVNRGSSAHRGDGNVSYSDQSPEEGGRILRKRPTDISESGIDDLGPVSPDRRISSTSNRQRGTTNSPNDRRNRNTGKDGAESSEGTENTERQDQSRRARKGSNTLEVSPTPSRKNADSADRAEAGNVTMGGAFGDNEDRDDKVRTGQTAVEPAGDVVKSVSSRKESLPVSLGNSGSTAVPARNKTKEIPNSPGAGRKSDQSRAVEASTVAWNDNDVEVLQRYIVLPQIFFVDIFK